MSDFKLWTKAIKACPTCGKPGESEDFQTVKNGCGEFDLDRPDELADMLTEDELHELKDKVTWLSFYCVSCDSHFEPYAEARQSRRNLARELF